MNHSLRLYSLCGVAIAYLAAAMFPSPAFAIVVESQTADTQVIEDATGLGLTIEDPANGTVYLDQIVVEWRDADDEGSPDWTKTGTVDGSATQAWLRDAGASITTTTTVASTGVTFHLEGDSNDGRVSLLVDGNEVAVIDMFDAGNNRVIVIVRNLTLATHTLVIDDLGTSNFGAGDDIAAWGGAATNQFIIPAVSEWGLVVLALLVFCLGTAALLRKRKLA